MSFKEVLAELPSMSVAERQMLMRRALELDDPPLSPQDEALIDERLAAHRRDSTSAVSLEGVKSRLRKQ